MYISIVIPAYNESELMGQTIDQIKYAMKNQTRDFQWEIIVCYKVLV
jgi:glycosyltransferase involved in cell wall biosynthesis